MTLPRIPRARRVARVEVFVRGLPQGLDQEIIVQLLDVGVVMGAAELPVAVVGRQACRALLANGVGYAAYPPAAGRAKKNYLTSAFFIW